MPRFVILRHETPAGYERGLHWDLMLEAGEALRTWALAAEPAWGDPIEGDALPDHRLAYLDFEGEVSGGRGVVSRWDGGAFRWMEQKSEKLVAELCGGRGSYSVTLEPELVGGTRWRVLFRQSAAGDD